jgi:hypothetical protein
MLRIFNWCKRSTGLSFTRRSNYYARYSISYFYKKSSPFLFFKPLCLIWMFRNASNESLAGTVELYNKHIFVPVPGMHALVLPISSLFSLSPFLPFFLSMIPLKGEACSWPSSLEKSHDPRFALFHKIVAAAKLQGGTKVTGIETHERFKLLSFLFSYFFSFPQIYCGVTCIEISSFFSFFLFSRLFLSPFFLFATFFLPFFLHCISN